MQIAFIWAFVGGASLLVVAPSWAVAVRVAAEGAALFLCFRGTRFVAPFAVFAAAILPLAGHAARVEPQAAGAVFVDALHVLSAGMWAGGILALAILQPPGGWRSAEAMVMFERFGRVAVIAFGVTALTGVLRATEQLNDVSQLWTTAYGIVLALKVAGVVIMLGASGLWRRGFVSAGWDAGATALVVGATALLAALPLPA
jgi:putative copper export protein